MSMSDEIIDKMSVQQIVCHITAILLLNGVPIEELPQVGESLHSGFKKLLKAIIKIAPKRTLEFYNASKEKGEDQDQGKGSLGSSYYTGGNNINSASRCDGSSN